MIQSITTKFIILILSVLLFACGGGGGSGNIDTTAIDTTAPVITLNGDAIIEHNYGDGYDDLGASATDNVDSSVTVIITGAVIVDMLNSYVITYTATDGAGNTSSIERTVNVVDLVGPVISLNGDAIIDHNYGDIYTDLGAQATDNVDSSVIVNTTGEVIDDMFSSYVITYTATDAAGNLSTVERLVNVVDMIGPVITLNGESSVTLGKGRVYKELSATAIDNIDGEIIVSSPSGTVDYDKLGHYELTYTATDTIGNVTVLVRSVDVVSPKPFVTTWKTDNRGISADNEIMISTNDKVGEYNYNVDWGDGKTNYNLTGDFTHTYDVAGTYTVTISGLFPQIYFSEPSHQFDGEKLLSVEQWGDGILLSLKKAFSGCENLVFNANDRPNLRAVTDMSYMFSDATFFNQDISDWDVSSVTDMSFMFERATSFNQDIGAWDVSSVTDMSSMFYLSRYFNQDIGAWDVSSVTDMSSMFFGSYFNQDIGAWDVTSVTDMSAMFINTSFNQDIGAWDVSSVTDMSYMFKATSFNQDIGAWDVSSVTDMSSMFELTTSFNQDIGTWDVSSVTDMSSMFERATSFNQDIGAWDVSSVTDMSFMFERATSFNQDIGAWDVSLVTDISNMFEVAISFNQDIGAWDVSLVTDISRMFEGATSFNQDIGAWDVSSVTYISRMFYNATSFNQDIGAWDVSSLTSLSSMFYNATSFNQDISAWDVSSITNMSSMFKRATSFNQDIGTWDVRSVKFLNDMLDGVTLSTENYDALLIGWSNQLVNRDVNFYGGDNQYSSSAQAARDILTNTYRWNITDGGVTP